MKNWVNDLFKTNKVAIGLVHLLALPGDPLYDAEGGMEKIYEFARNDVIALQNGGIDGILFSNEFSFPYQGKVKEEVIAAMAMIIGRLKAELTVPYGANVISDQMATISLSAAIEGKFTRGTFYGAYATNGGILDTNIGEYLRLRHNLHCDNLKMVHYVIPESSVDIGGRDPINSAKTAKFMNMPDAFGVAGAVAGKKVDTNLINELRNVMPYEILFATTGVNIDSIEEIYSLVDAAFVATHFKVDGVFENPIDQVRVKKFMDKLKEYREKA